MVYRQGLLWRKLCDWTRGHSAECDCSTTGLAQADYSAFINASEGIVCNKNFWHTQVLFGCKNKVTFQALYHSFYWLHPLWKTRITNFLIYTLAQEKYKSTEFLTILNNTGQQAPYAGTHRSTNLRSSTATGSQNCNKKSPGRTEQPGEVLANSSSSMRYDGWCTLAVRFG